jgi:cytochrome b subunit of formate dehydrogenase
MPIFRLIFNVQTLRKIIRALPVLVIGFAILGLASSARSSEIPDSEIQNRRCLTSCHGDSKIATLSYRERLEMVDPRGAPATGPARRPELYITGDQLPQSAHKNVACVSCHPDATTLPHKTPQAKATCDTGPTCHAKQVSQYVQGSHAEAAAKGDPNAPTCVTCHGSHDILPKTDRNSRTFPLNVVKICGNCHEKHMGKTPGGLNAAGQVALYLDSVHGRAVVKAGLTVAATCADCHGEHDVHSSKDPRSSVNRAHVPDTCGKCHVGIEEPYAKSVHGDLLAQGDSRAPVCSDCHTAHEITRTDSPRFTRDIVAECGNCHDKPMPGSREKASLYETYRESYHGQVTALGSTRAAKCSDCHGAHNIRRINDPLSPLNAANRLATCQKCHKGAKPNFASFAPHADFRNSDRYPILHYVFLYFVIMMSASFGFFGLHCVLWLVRSVIERLKGGPEAVHPKPDYSKGAIQRFSRVDRINHGLVIVTFFGLALTGLPLLYSEKEWGQVLAGIFGGAHACGILHRIFAIMLIGNFVVHGAGVLQRFRRMGVKQMLLGPTTMLPRWKDLKDCLGMYRWFFRGGKKPKFDRWTYWEKFDYMAEVGGSMIIGVSGLLLWFPVFFSSYLPGWMFNVATIVHGFEALLAVGFIFTIHFFNAHLRLEKFPVDDVMFTGRLPEEEFKHERGAEYERVVASGEIEKLRVAAPPAWYRHFAVFMGIAAMTVGTTIIALIILAALKVI